MSLGYKKRELYRALKAIKPEDLWGEDAALLEELEDNREVRDIVEDVESGVPRTEEKT